MDKPVVVREFSKPSVRSTIEGNPTGIKSFVESCKMHFNRFSDTLNTFDTAVRLVRKQKEASKPGAIANPTPESGLSDVRCNDNFVFRAGR